MQIDTYIGTWLSARTQIDTYMYTDTWLSARTQIDTYMYIGTHGFMLFCRISIIAS